MAVRPGLEINQRRDANTHYESLVENLANLSAADPVYAKFKPLLDFLRLDSRSSPAEYAGVTPCSPSINILRTTGGNGAVFHENIDEIELDLEAKDGAHLAIVENISPSLIKSLGGSWGIPIQFFLDYLNANHREADGLRDDSDERPTITPRRWLQKSDVLAELSPLHSRRQSESHVTFHFVTPRQILKEGDEGGSTRNRKKPWGIEADFSKMNVERNVVRWNSLRHTIDRGGWEGEEEIMGVAFISATFSLWFEAKESVNGPSMRGVVLVDPPFRSKNTTFRQQQPVREYFSTPSSSAAADPEGKKLKWSTKDCLLASLNRQDIRSTPPEHWPAIVVDEIACLMATEWLALYGYLHRDLLNIDRIISTGKTTYYESETILTRLFNIQRFLREFDSTMDEQLDVLRNSLPTAWATSSATAGAERDFWQVKRLGRRNLAAISQATEYISNRMSIIETRSDVQGRRTVGYLTVIATLTLPFNVVAAVMGMQTDYGPDGEKFALFWQISAGVLLAALGTYGVGWILAQLQFEGELGRFWKRL